MPAPVGAGIRAVGGGRRRFGAPRRRRRRRRRGGGGPHTVRNRTMASAPAIIRIQPTTDSSMPATSYSTAKARMAPTASRKTPLPIPMSRTSLVSSSSIQTARTIGGCLPHRRSLQSAHSVGARGSSERTGSECRRRLDTRGDRPATDACRDGRRPARTRRVHPRCVPARPRGRRARRPAAHRRARPHPYDHRRRHDRRHRHDPHPRPDRSGRRHPGRARHRRRRRVDTSTARPVDPNHYRPTRGRP